jgi:hypothetical protein
MDVHDRAETDAAFPASSVVGKAELVDRIERYIDAVTSSRSCR